MEQPRPTCPECGSVIDPRQCVTVNNRDEVPLRDLFDTATFAVDRYSGIYCTTDCVLDAFSRGYPEHRGAGPAEVDE